MEKIDHLLIENNTLFENKVLKWKRIFNMLQQVFLFTFILARQSSFPEEYLAMRRQRTTLQNVLYHVQVLTKCINDCWHIIISNSISLDSNDLLCLKNDLDVIHSALANA